MDNGRIMKELKELQEGVKNVSANFTGRAFIPMDFRAMVHSGFQMR